MMDPQIAILLTRATALELVASFFDKEWAETDIDHVHLRRVTGGMINTLHLISRTTTAEFEPAAILIRHFGVSGKLEDPPSSSTTLSATEQAVVYWEMGRRGWGPKVYSYFPGGRLEEYLDAHPLTALEASQPEIRRDIARSYARLHSLQLPLRTNSYQLIVRELSQGEQNKHEQVLSELLAIDHPAAQMYATLFQRIDWATELAWVSSLFGSRASSFPFQPLT